MNAYIYIEGGASGADSKYLKLSCQEAFHRLLDRMGFSGRKPRLVACGGRGAVYERFCTEHGSNNGGYVAMWIDSEDPMDNVNQAWSHLANVTTVAAWEKPGGAEDDQVLFMTTCMETWIVADRAALQAHYGRNLKANKLPPMTALEGRDRHSVQGCLEQATSECKNAFAKGKRSFDILMKLDPATLKLHLPSFVRVDSILKEKL